MAIPSAAKVICEPNNSADSTAGREGGEGRGYYRLTVKLVDRYVKHFVALDFAILSVNIRR